MEVEIELGRINMCSALMHVASDALRSITTLIEGFLILYTDLDSENTDAVASLVLQRRQKPPNFLYSGSNSSNFSRFWTILPFRWYSIHIHA